MSLLNYFRPTTMVDYHDLYPEVLSRLLSVPDHAIKGLTFNLIDADKNVTRSPVRNFDVANAQVFWEWIASGIDSIEPMRDLVPNIEMFNKELDGRNAYYGPRINQQVADVCSELVGNPSSRRACIMILAAQDRTFLAAKRNGNTIEYPCTISITFHIEDDELNCQVVMRSNDMCATVCYDVYNFTMLQMKILETVKALLPDTKLGWYQHIVLDAHIPPAQVDRAYAIVKEYYNGE